MNAPDQRKLAAIMFTDMVGCSALSQRDEALALKLLEEQRHLLRGILLRHATSRACLDSTRSARTCGSRRWKRTWGSIRERSTTVA